MNNKITLPTGVVITIKNNAIEVKLPGIENRTNNFKKLMKLWC